jgi:hypothetical protein
MTAHRARARAVTKILCGKSPLSWGQCASTTLRVLIRTSRATAQRFTLAPRPIYLTPSASGFAAGGKSVHRLLEEVLATKLSREQACWPMVCVTSLKHCDAIALFALLLARSLATSLIFDDWSPAQASASPRRSCRRLNSRPGSSMQKSAADTESTPQQKTATKSALILQVSDPIFMAYRSPDFGTFIPRSAIFRQKLPSALTGYECRAKAGSWTV